MVFAHVRDIAVGRLRWRIHRALGGDHNLRHAGLSITTGGGAPSSRHAAFRAMKTNSRPGRSGASRTSSTAKPAAASESASSPRVRNRSVESEVSTAPSPSNTKVVRKETRLPSAFVTSIHVWTGPAAGVTARR
jgi:hypothetical protein